MLTLHFTVCCVCIQARLNTDGTSTDKVADIADGASPPLSLTPELLVVGRDHHGELPGMGIVQAGEELLLSRRRDEVSLLLMTCQVHHLGGDVCDYEQLKREK